MGLEHYLDIWEDKGRHFARCPKGMWCRIRIGRVKLVHPEHTHVQWEFSDPEGITYVVICSVEEEVIL